MILRRGGRLATASLALAAACRTAGGPPPEPARPEAAPAAAPAPQAAPAPPPGETWKFVAGGDSRNCGDVVMPAVAAGAAAAGAAFYWHLGDYRAIYDFDRDFLAQPEHKTGRGVAGTTIFDYQKLAWDDFLSSQIAPFGSIPVFLGIGNHELVSPKTRAEYLAQFADWLNAPEIQRQRLKDDPKDHRLKTYYHWIRGGVDFLTLDNASPDQFDGEQMRWLERVIARDEADPAITTIVVGMHAALPDSITADHGMNDWAQGEKSGRRAYERLLEARKKGKKVYVVASHSHFYIRGVFDTPYWRAHGGVLPGWIIGTTGAIRYKLPEAAASAEEAKTNVYGYLLATVGSDGAIRFDFKEIAERDVPAPVVTRFGGEFVHQCFEGNREGSR
ncbi:MAG: metallophosphoesterase family protein [Acidobacteriota bacterium]